MNKARELKYIIVKSCKSYKIKQLAGGRPSTCSRGENAWNH